MPRLLPLLCTLLIALGWSAPAWATERLAVLELTGKSLGTEERATLTDTVRGSVVEALGGRVQVMTKENMEVMMTDMGMDASCVSEGACEVETARNLGVDYVVSGSVASMSGTLVVSLKLLETRSGQMLSSKQVTGKDALALMQGLVEPSAGLVAVIGGAPQAAAAGRRTPGRPSKAGSDWTSPGVGTMKWIPASTFTMGAPPDPTPMKGLALTPEHEVTLSRGFLLMEHEVTQAEWNALMPKDPMQDPDGYGEPGKRRACATVGVGPDLPMLCVSWSNAAAFANALSAQEGLTPAYYISGASATVVADADGYRLPTEAEWEFAARGGQDFQFAGSDDACEVGNTLNPNRKDAYKEQFGKTWNMKSIEGDCDDGFTGPTPVKSFLPNGYGLYDMTGNAEEWVYDRFADYPTGGVTDPMGPSSAPRADAAYTAAGLGEGHVLRGSGWNMAQALGTVFGRQKFYDLLGAHYEDAGFRLARSVP